MTRAFFSNSLDSLPSGFWKLARDGIRNQSANLNQKLQAIRNHLSTQPTAEEMEYSREYHKRWAYAKLNDGFHAEEVRRIRANEAKQLYEELLREYRDEERIMIAREAYQTLNSSGYEPKALTEIILATGDIELVRSQLM